MRLIPYLIIGLTLIIPYANAAPPTQNPAQVSAGEITAGTETELRSYSPADVKSFIDTHGGADAYTVKVDAAATAAYLYNAGSGAVRAGTNVTIDDNGDYITVNASLAGGAVDTEGTLNADEIAVMHDLDTIKSLTEAEFKTAYNMEAGTDYLAPDGVGTSLTALNGENIQDDTIDDDSIDFGDITLDDFINADGDHISVASDDIFDFTRNDSGTVTITASDDDANASLTVVAGGTGALTLGGASNTLITATTDGGSVALDGYVGIGTDPADEGTIRLENNVFIAFEAAPAGTDVRAIGVNASEQVEIGSAGASAVIITPNTTINGAVVLGDGGDNFSVASDGIDIDTSGNITNAGTIACGKVTSSAAFESATGLFDVTGAAAITVGSADVTAITLQTDDTGDGTDLVLPAQSVNGSEILNNTVTATQLGATLTFADGDVVDLSGITHTGSTDEGLALPTWANVTPTSDKAWAAWDGTNQILKIYDGGWVSISPSGAPTDATYLTLSVDATLSDERVLTESTQGIDFTDGGAGSTLTVSLDTTEIDATTWSDGANSSNTWTFDLDTTDFNMVASNGLMTFSDAVTVTDTLTANNGIDLGTSNSITGTTAMTFGAGTETIAINSSDWDIDATGVMTGIGNITSDGVVTSTGFTIGAAAITETELEILDGATLSTTQINYLASSTGTTGTTNTNVVFSASPTIDSLTITTALTATDLIDSAHYAADSIDNEHINWADIDNLDDEGMPIDFALTAEATVADDIAIRFGGAATDWYAEFDDSVDDQMLWHTTATASIATTDPMFEILADFGTANGTGMTADQQIFGIAKGTQASNVALLTLDEDGDLSINGTLTVGVSGNSYVQLDTNGSSVESGNRLYFVANELHCSEAGDDDVILTQDDGATLTGTTWSFESVTNMILPTTVADASGEISMSTGNQLKWHDGAKVVTIDTTTTTDNYVLKYDNATATFNLEEDATGGSPTIDTVGDAAGDATITFDAGEEISWQYTGAYTTGPQFLIQQQTGNPTGGTLFEVRGADSDSSVLEVGDGTNVWTVSTAGQLANAGTATINFAAASDILVGGSQIDHDDMAGAAVVASTGGLNIDEDIDIDFDAADEEMVITNSAEYGAGGSQVTIDNADADVGAQMYLLNLDYSADDGQANADYIIAQDSGGTVFVLGQDGDIATTDGDYTTTNGAITAGGAVTGGTVTDGTVTLAGDGTVTGISAGGYPDDSVLFADLDDDGNYGPFTGTWEWNSPFEIYSTSSGDQTIASAQLGIKLDEDLLVTHGGASGEVQDEVGISLLQTLIVRFDPEWEYDNSTNNIIDLLELGDEAPHGITIVEWKIEYVNGDPTTEIDLDLMCDTTPDWNPAAGGTVMDVLDTTAGTATADSGFDSATCANANNMYLRFGADPVDPGEIVRFKLLYYLNED